MAFVFCLYLNNISIHYGVLLGGIQLSVATGRLRTPKFVKPALGVFHKVRHARGEESNRVLQFVTRGGAKTSVTSHFQYFRINKTLDTLDRRCSKSV